MTKKYLNYDVDELIRLALSVGKDEPQAKPQLLHFVNTTIEKSVKDTRKMVVEEIQEIANTTRPNLLLNEIVNKI